MHPILPCRQTHKTPNSPDSRQEHRRTSTRSRAVYLARRDRDQQQHRDDSTAPRQTLRLPRNQRVAVETEYLVNPTLQNRRSNKKNTETTYTRQKTSRTTVTTRLADTSRNRNKSRMIVCFNTMVGAKAVYACPPPCPEFQGPETPPQQTDHHLPHGPQCKLVAMRLVNAKQRRLHDEYRASL